MDVAGTLRCSPNHCCIIAQGYTSLVLARSRLHASGSGLEVKSLTNLVGYITFTRLEAEQHFTASKMYLHNLDVLPDRDCLFFFHFVISFFSLNYSLRLSLSVTQDIIPVHHNICPSQLPEKTSAGSPLPNTGVFAQTNKK